MSITLKAPKELYFYETANELVELTNVQVRILTQEESVLFEYELKFLEKKKFYVKINGHKWYHYLSPFKPKELQVTSKHKTCYITREVSAGRPSLYVDEFYVDEFGNEVKLSYPSWHPERDHNRSDIFSRFVSIEFSLICECTDRYIKDQASVLYQIEIEKINNLNQE